MNWNGLKAKVKSLTVQIVRNYKQRKLRRYFMS
ncbi:hypothetical protein DEU42_12031 [Flavobacterium sp. AG291]|nr:hypothetical protein DEU42_12031 [Flavobacterium sp. AG291]